MTLPLNVPGRCPAIVIPCDWGGSGVSKGGQIVARTPADTAVCCAVFASDAAKLWGHTFPHSPRQLAVD